MLLRDADPHSPTWSNTTLREKADRAARTEMRSGRTHRSKWCPIARKGNRSGQLQHEAEPPMLVPQAVHCHEPKRAIDRRTNKRRIEVGRMIGGHDERRGRDRGLPVDAQSPPEAGQQPYRGNDRTPKEAPPSKRRSSGVRRRGRQRVPPVPVCAADSTAALPLRPGLAQQTTLLEPP